MAQALRVESHVEEVFTSTEIPILSPVDWMSCLAWLRARRDALLRALWLEQTQLQAPDHGCHGARVDALAIFDRRIAELEAR